MRIVSTAGELSEMVLACGGALAISRNLLLIFQTGFLSPGGPRLGMPNRPSRCFLCQTRPSMALHCALAGVHWQVAGVEELHGRQPCCCTFLPEDTVYDQAALQAAAAGDRDVYASALAGD